jgi:ArsR family transcriptional regulator
MDHDYKKFNDAAELLKALAHPVRICIVNGLLHKGECNVSYMQNCLDVPQSTVSQHLQKLRSAGIIEASRNGTEVYYTVSDKRAAEIVRILSGQEE